MSKSVDHETRRREILRKALHLFAEMGYQQVTFQQLADVCGVSRTALYKYFNTKKEIFDNAIYQMVQDINDDLNHTFQDKQDWDCRHKLEHIIKTGIELCEYSPDLLRAIIEYLLGQIRQGEVVERKVKRHTIGMHYTLKNIIQEGIQNGEFKPVSPIQTADLFFNLLIATATQIILYNHVDREKLNAHFDFIIQALLVNLPDASPQ